MEEGEWAGRAILKKDRALTGPRRVCTRNPAILDDIMQYRNHLCFHGFHFEHHAQWVQDVWSAGLVPLTRMHRRSQSDRSFQCAHPEISMNTSDNVGFDSESSGESRELCRPRSYLGGFRGWAAQPAGDGPRSP